MADAGRKSVWNNQSHEDLLMCTIEYIKPGKKEIEDLVVKMAARGHTFTYNAIKYCPYFFYYAASTLIRETSLTS